MTPEEALIHAYTADVARLPPDIQPMFDPKRLAAAHLSGKSTPSLNAFRDFLKKGHPDYQPQDDDERAIQEQMLSGYSGRGWTPQQVSALGRHPHPYEFSPGGQYLDQLEARQRLYADFDDKEEKGWFPGPAAWTGVNKAGFREGAAKLYAKQLGRTHAYLPGTGPGTVVPGIPEGGVRELFNPENSVGSLTTKMTGAVSDAASLLGTALLRKTDPTAALGDAAVRYHGADFQRTNPVLVADNGWRENDALIRDGRGAHAASEGMTAGDTFRATAGQLLPESWNGQIPYAQPVINAVISFGNGMLDGTGFVGSTKAVPKVVQAASNAAAKTAIPGVSQFARSTSNSIGKHLAANPTGMGRYAHHVTDEAADVTNGIALAAELMNRDKRSNAEWSADQKAEESQRQQAIKQLEGMNSQIVRPKTPVTRAGGWLSGLIAQ